MSQIKVKDEYGAEVPSINIRIAVGRGSSQSAIYDLFVNRDGTTGWPIPNWPDTKDLTLWVNEQDKSINAAADPTFNAQSLYLGDPGVVDSQGDINIKMTHRGEHGQLATRGVDFIDENGNPWCFRGYTIHTILANLKKDEDVTPLFDQAQGYGANALVTIGTHLSQWKKDNGFYVNPFDPGYQDLLAKLFDLAAVRKIRVAHAALADCQGLSDDEKMRIWHMTCEVAKGRWNVLPRGGNEDLANSWDGAALDLPDLQGCLASRGSRGINNPPHNAYWQWAEWEGRREPLYKAFDDSGAGILELQHGYTDSGSGEKHGPFPCPLVNIEPPYFYSEPVDMYGDERWTSDQDALRLGLNIGANSAGGAFGSSHGLVGQLNNEGEDRCAEQFFRGLLLGFQR